MIIIIPKLGKSGRYRGAGNSFLGLDGAKFFALRLSFIFTPRKKPTPDSLTLNV
jgi:hypothetical protein